jgi:hypothetical protein
MILLPSVISGTYQFTFFLYLLDTKPYKGYAVAKREGYLLEIFIK